MRTINVYDTAKGRDIMNYLANNGIDSDSIQIWGHKNQVEVSDEEIFQKIVKVTGQKQLRKFHGLDFWTKIPRDGSNSPHEILVCLDMERTQQFLRKYGREYEVVRIK
ncbi:MAG: hypothetical protein Q8P15_01450 [Nanoarchaeota archaeon]|nr:hypothetical protein [Nanoarchaeota archaeon]